MKIKNPFKNLNKFEKALWICSMCVVSLSYLIPKEKDYLTLFASLIGVTALIFIASGRVIGQALVIIFALFYGAISFHYKYYGEVITYLGMSAPMAVLALISWIKHPYESSGVVAVNKITKKHVFILGAITTAVTVAFYFILSALNTENLLVSTVSVTTSFAAVSLTYLRSPYYAIGYSLNDLVLITLWVMASIEKPSYIPMVLCFVTFLANDIYGFISWRRMERKQHNI